MHSKQQAQTPLRADARRNREQIIEAARVLFVQVGPHVPMEEIARAAGVGVGTLYRRFPDRDELVKAVSLDNFTRLVALARLVERAEPDPAKALTTLLSSALEARLGITMTPMTRRAYQAINDSPEVAEQRAEAIAVARRLLHRSQECGAIRPDVEIGDTMLALLLVSRLAPHPDDELGGMALRRMFALVMDGLRTGTGTPLPGRPVDYHDIEELRARDGLTRFEQPGEPEQAP
ncbi:TetR/AcrR family transcriptional regulator [Actinokineospora sp. G85]|uniref:TetR/AcrR family transcriptional regulator n=1 Tax=Actinokineospora sp. G85 TaxID=3406626 RepID=UPI003C75B430